MYVLCLFRKVVSVHPPSPNGIVIKSSRAYIEFSSRAYMDSLLILILVFVASCGLVFALMALVSWSINWIMNKYHVGRTGSEASRTSSNPDPTNLHVSIPILEARAQRPKDASDIESTCLVILPHHTSVDNKVITDYAIGMKSDAK